MGKRILNSTNSTNIFNLILYVIASIFTFYGVRVVFPVFLNFGKGLLVVLPAIMIYALPLFLLIIYNIFIRTGSVNKRWKQLHLTGVVLSLVSFLSLFLLIILIPTSFKNKIIFGGASPLYPLDVFLYSFLFLTLGISLLILSFANREERFSKDVLFKSTTKSKKVALSFYLAFATYFFGEFLFIIHYFFEPYHFYDNWFRVIVTYLSFLLPTLLLVLNGIYTQKKNNDLKSLYKSLVIIFSSSLGVALLIIICLMFNSQYMIESMQFEFSIGFLLKMPVGLIIIYLLVLIPSLVLLINSIKKYHPFGKKHEQK